MKLIHFFISYLFTRKWLTGSLKEISMIQHDSSKVSSICQHIPVLLTSLQHFPPVANKKIKQNTKTPLHLKIEDWEAALQHGKCTSHLFFFQIIFHFIQVKSKICLERRCVSLGRAVQSFKMRSAKRGRVIYQEPQNIHISKWLAENRTVCASSRSQLSLYVVSY